MKGKRRQHGADLKARVALAALREDRTINEVAAQYEVHPTAVTKWKQRTVSELPRIFSEASVKGVAEAEAREAKLYEQIGRLKMEPWS